jgi:hypothetical protein
MEVGMAFPAGLTLVTVTGQFDEFPDGGGSGWVRFWYDAPLTGAADHSVVPSIDVKATVTSGAFTVDLPAGNDPGWSPAFSLKVQAQVGAVQRRGTITLDYADTDVWFDDLIQWDTAEVEASATYATLAQLTAAAATASVAYDVAERVSSLGEYMLRRDDANFHLAMQSGRVYLTHFTARVTETILSVDTHTGDVAATSATNAWVGFMKWTGTQYTLDSVSVDDPTRWTAANTTYNTSVFQTDDAHFGAADLTRPGFNKVAGTDYVGFFLWNGSGTPPQLNCNLLNPDSALDSPRKAAYIDLTAPPSSALQAEWVAGMWIRFQGHMKR